MKDRVKTGLSNWAYNRRIISTFSQDDDLWRAAYRNMQRWRPSYLIGYVSSLLNFARYLERESLTGSVRLRAVLAAAESFDEVKRKYLQAVLGAPVLNTYGSREFMSIAGECGAGGGLHYAAENLVVETDGPEGVPGDLLITDLHNYGTVFLRYRIGDAGVVTENRCQCGRGLPMLEALGGRSAHSLEMGDGRTVSGLLFTHVLKDLPEVLQFQVVQTRADHIVISAVVSQEVSARSIQFFSNEMQRYLGPNTWEFKPVMSLPLLPSGKVQTIVPFRRENVSSSD